MTVKPSPSIRAVQREATRQKILDAAVALLVECGSAATTTVEVQQRANVSRGALLHHFPSHAEMLAATVEALVQRNEESVRHALAALPADLDPIDRATRALANAFAQPAYLAELELWAVARTNPTLRASLRAAERRARRDFERVVSELFAPLRDRPACSAVVALSVEFLRGLALAGVLRGDDRRRAHLLDGWSWAVHALLEHPSVPPFLSLNKE
jgi:AcrR family transcriptional regulator